MLVIPYLSPFCTCSRVARLSTSVGWGCGQLVSFWTFKIWFVHASHRHTSLAAPTCKQYSACGPRARGLPRCQRARRMIDVVEWVWRNSLWLLAIAEWLLLALVDHHDFDLMVMVAGRGQTALDCITWFARRITGRISFGVTWRTNLRNGKRRHWSGWWNRHPDFHPSSDCHLNRRSARLSHWDGSYWEVFDVYSQSSSYSLQPFIDPFVSLRFHVVGGVHCHRSKQCCLIRDTLMNILVIRIWIVRQVLNFWMDAQHWNSGGESVCGSLQVLQCSRIGCCQGSRYRS